MEKNSISLYQWCLDNDRKSLIEEWDIDKNIISTKDVSYGSNKSFWWKCRQGHNYKNVVNKRTLLNSSCPICSGRRLVIGVNDLATTDPELLKEWDYKKNNFKPTEVTRVSHKRVYWICEKCGYEWNIGVFSRTLKGSGCAKCALTKRGEAKHKTSLLNNGYLADEKVVRDWDYDKNYPLTPKDFTPTSNRYAYWKCHKCGYEWKTKVSNRVHGRGCPLCGNKVVVKGVNDLATTHPDLAKEWHPTKNGNLTPFNVSYGCGKKVYWLCPNGHEYSSTINHRTSVNGTNCPICNIGRQTSFAEQAIFFYIKKEFPDAINKYKPDFLKPMELDIYIPSIYTAIEYDGAAWHKEDRLLNEQKKYKLCHENGIRLYRIREKMPELCSDIADRSFGCNGERLFEHKNLNEMILIILEQLTFKFRFMLDVDVDRDEHSILSYIKELDTISFESEYPDLAKEWHPTRNGNSKPNMFKPHSDHNAWWICPICGNEYSATFSHRSYGTGCPKCGVIKSHMNRGVPVEMLDAESGKVIKCFNSISEAARKTKLSAGNIGMVCRGNTGRKKVGGYIWRYASKKSER